MSNHVEKSMEKGTGETEGFEDLFEAIRSRKVTMRPRWYFVLRDIGGIIAIVIILLMAIYLASFIVFVLHQDGAWFVPVFGLAGWYALFNALPWILIFLSTAFVVVLAFLAKRYPFGYKWPLLYSFLAIIFLIAAVCFVFVDSALYNEIFSSAISQEIPLLGYYYPGIGILGPSDIHRGYIVVTGANGFVLRDNAGMISNVLIDEYTKVSFGTTFQAGDMTVVFGNRSATGTIIAIGVEKLSSQ